MSGGDDGKAQHEADALVRRAYGVQDQDEALALYRDWATTYERSMVDGLGYASPARCAALLLEHLPRHDVPILDVGCGTGLAGAELAAAGCTDLHGVDLSAEMLEQARGRGIYASLVEADLTADLPLPHERFAAAICTGTFTHAHVDARCLDELLRVLRPGALFAFTVHLQVWQPMGFAARLPALCEEGRIEVVSRFQDSYYFERAEPEGQYCLVRRL